MSYFYDANSLDCSVNGEIMVGLGGDRYRFLREDFNGDVFIKFNLLSPTLEYLSERGGCKVVLEFKHNQSKQSLLNGTYRVEGKSWQMDQICPEVEVRFSYVARDDG